MGWYGTPEGEIKHFDINRETIKETKAGWRNVEAEGSAAGHSEDRLDEGRDFGAQKGVEPYMGTDRGCGGDVPGSPAEADLVEADNPLAGVHTEKSTQRIGDSMRDI